ncbi:hypothetical protein DXT76_06070 [Halobacillus trueperi]|uniref:PepSY domain-containing protein n=2 Tax=Halobacillus trueperi TaxID=156205 RepID=A0A3D8VQT4_9BACI|nr:hypothetical protein DXT76_06070 [Halobacillus trueperi]
MPSQVKLCPSHGTIDFSSNSHFPLSLFSSWVDIVRVEQIRGGCIMKKKWIIGGIVSVVVLGGAFGVSAVSGNDQFAESAVDFSQKEAEAAAKEEVDGLKIEKVEKDKEGGISIYEIEGQTEDGKEAEVEVDANTGEVVQVEHNEDDSDETSAEDLKVKKEEAEKTAKDKASGSEMKEMEIDDGDYEFKFQDDAIEYEVTVDGQTGEVIEFEKDKLEK